MLKKHIIFDFLRKNNGSIFTNSFYQNLEINYDNFFEINNIKIDFDKPLLSQIRRISFEISNACNFSTYHKKCPASWVKIKKTLPINIIERVLTELSEIDYEGVVAFHRYNEPLIDPRLFYLINLAHTLCPNSKILILTNGFYLTEQLALELSKLNIWILAVSAYSNDEFKRLSSIDLKIPYIVFNSILDDRKDIYSKDPLDLKVACMAPLCDLTINVEGKVVLCCLDWKNINEFGNCDDAKLSDIINNQYFIGVAKDLSNKNRCLDICRRCNMVR